MLTEKPQHGRAQRLLVQDDLDELAAHGRMTDHADDYIVSREQYAKGVHDGAVPRDVAQVDLVVDPGRHVAGHQEAAMLAHLHGDGARADAVEHLPRQRIGHVRRRLQNERGGVGGVEPVLEPVQPEIGDRRHIDQHFRDHHEQNREDQELAGQAKPRRSSRDSSGGPPCGLFSSVASVIGRTTASVSGSVVTAPSPLAGEGMSVFQRTQIG